ncbi:uncharacterized protein B4U79_12545, partial [Dinothrombium tinctorium]
MLCQLRLDFIDFELNQPSNGNCESDQFVVTGQNANSIVPALCGFNSGQHLYVDIENTFGPYVLRTITRGDGVRLWNIRVSLIECTNPSRAPENCLQYFTGPNGVFSSFNYVDTNQMEALAKLSPNQNMFAFTYLNNLNYAICFRKEAAFCTQTYSASSSSSPFAIINVAPNGSALFDISTAGAGVLKCQFDFLLLSGIRFCGTHLNPFGINQEPVVDLPITDSNSGPFIARFTSDRVVPARGFKLHFQQNPCTNSIENPVITFSFGAYRVPQNN